MTTFLKFAAYTVFLSTLAIVCYRRPVPDDLDRYIYEAVVRGRSQDFDSVYNTVKHESPRAEASLVFASPQRLRELEPLYAIRPLYIESIRAVSAVVPIQKAISFISAASLFGIGVVVLLWTMKPLESVLLMAAYPIVTLGRTGTPDALAALMSILSLWLIVQNRHQLLALAVLFLSLGVRTDNVLLLLVVLAWLAWEKRLPLYASGLGAIIAVAIVIAINRWAGNYGWVVLFRFSFLGGGRCYPSQIPHSMTPTEYLSALARGAVAIFSQVSSWLLLGVLAWVCRPERLLLLVAAAAGMHFLLFPSAEIRYLVWAFVVAGVVLLNSITEWRGGELVR